MTTTRRSTPSIPKLCPHAWPWLLLLATGCRGSDDATAEGEADESGTTSTTTSGFDGGSLPPPGDDDPPATTGSEVSETSSSTDTGVVGPPADCPVGPALTTTRIDDLEHMGTGLPSRDGRSGGWYHYNDGTSGMQFPVALTVTDEAAVEGTRSIRTYGEGFSSWGAALGLSIRADGRGDDCPYDASAYEGITFWARGQDQVFMHVSTVATVPVDEGGTCASATLCWDDHGKSILLTDEWTQYTVRWDEVQQAGWGIPADFDPSRIVLFHWQDQDASSFDIWVDDLRFFPGEDDGSTTGPEDGESSTGPDGSTGDLDVTSGSLDGSTGPDGSTGDLDVTSGSLDGSTGPDGSTDEVDVTSGSLDGSTGEVDAATSP